jgi:DNA-binding LytR/AlgR family response regulator
MRKLTFGEIECITVLDRKVIAIDASGDRYTLKERLRELEDILPSYFIRINKSAIANEHSIKRFDAAFSGGIDAVFACGYREYVSRRCFSEIRRRYEGL